MPRRVADRPLAHCCRARAEEGPTEASVVNASLRARISSGDQIYGRVMATPAEETRGRPDTLNLPLKQSAQSRPLIIRPDAEAQLLALARRQVSELSGRLKDYGL